MRIAAAAVNRVRRCERKVDTFGQNAGRCAGLQAAETKAQASQRVRKSLRRCFALAAAANALLSRDQHALQEGAGGEHHILCVESATVLGFHTGNPAPLRRIAREQIFYQAVVDRQVLLVLQHLAHRLGVKVFVALGAQRLYGGSLAAVEQANLDQGAVGILAHFAAKGIDLPYQMSLGRAANRGIAGHERDAIAITGHDESPAAHTRRRQRRLTAGMTGTHDNYVIACTLIVLVHRGS